jgi:hypothetical protein
MNVLVVGHVVMLVVGGRGHLAVPSHLPVSTYCRSSAG